jgi:hypothetical protein
VTPTFLLLAMLVGSPTSNLPSMLSVSPEDRDLLIRTVIGEAANQPALGQRAVAHVVLNRLNRGGYGASVPDVLFKPKQFEPWNTRRSELLSYAETDPHYQRAARQVDAVLGGAEDPTNGATHFANRATVSARGNRRALGWIDNMAEPVQIGGHIFGKADEGRGGGGKVRTVDTSDDFDPPTKGGQGGRLRGDGGGGTANNFNLASGGTASNFNLASLLSAINEQPKNEAHAQVKNLMADMADSIMGELGATTPQPANDAEPMQAAA